MSTDLPQGDGTSGFTGWSTQDDNCWTASCKQVRVSIGYCLSGDSTNFSLFFAGRSCGVLL